MTSDFFYIFPPKLKKIPNFLANTYKNPIICDNNILRECEIKIRNHIKNLKKPSEYKIAGAIIFWMRKLKPFVFEIKQNKWHNPCLYLNEYIAVIYGYEVLYHLQKAKDKPNKKLHPRFIEDLAIQLRYSAFSPSSLEMLIASQYQQ